MNKNKKLIDAFDTSHYIATSEPHASVESIASYQTGLVAAIRTDSLPSSFIETKDEVQGGKYCLRGTRVPVSTIKDAVRGGCTYAKMATTLKKYFRLKVSPEEIGSALREYNQIIGEYE